MSFFTFVAQYYVERLHVYEQLDLTRCSAAQLLDVAGEASALHKFLTDILEEGYTTTVDRFVGQTDAITRLQRFLSTVLHVLGPPSERERFYLFPELILLPQLTSETLTGGMIYEVQAYLDHLDHVSDQPVDIAACFESVHQQQRWQTKTQMLLTEMVAFLHWICQRLTQPVPVVPVPLLRDTLLIHLGLTWLRRDGMPIPAPQPALIGRKFADLCGNGRAIHGALGDRIYRVLMDVPRCDLATLRRHFATAVHADPAIPASFTQACRDYLATLALDGAPLFIESGVQGTFPLFLLSLTGNTGEMVFYTTTPWLYPIYEPIVFRKNYNYLREMETIVAHDHLFQFWKLRDGKVLVQETTNEIVRRLARYEIRTFKALVQQTYSSAQYGETAGVDPANGGMRQSTRSNDRGQARGGTAPMDIGHLIVETTPSCEDVRFLVDRLPSRGLHPACAAWPGGAQPGCAPLRRAVAARGGRGNRCGRRGAAGRSV